MRKGQELTDNNSCLNKAAFDEPLFVLRAHDKLAPIVVRLWADLALLHNCKAEKVQEAYQLATAMESWHNRKFPD